MPPPSATPCTAAIQGFPIASILANASCALLGSTIASSRVWISSSIWRMSAPAINDDVPSPVKTTATTSSLRDRWSTTITSSSIARSFSALTGGFVTVTVATRLPGATTLYWIRKYRYRSNSDCSSDRRCLRCQSSMTVFNSVSASGLRSVVTSPTSVPSTSARTIRRMYLPLRVSGNCETSMKSAGTATAPFSVRTRSNNRRLSSCVSLRPVTGTTKASGVSPFSRCGAPTTSTLPTGESGSSALSRSTAPSISSVPMRCPLTLITSSLRPCSENEPSSCAIAKSPCVYAHTPRQRCQYPLVHRAASPRQPPTTLPFSTWKLSTSPQIIRAR